MGLKLYSGENTPFSVLPDRTSSIQAVMNGDSGGTILTKIYIHGDDQTKKYTNITIQPIPTEMVGPDNPSRFSFKLLSGDRQPTENEWKARQTGSLLVSSPDYDISASPKNYYLPEIQKADATYFPFWMRIDIPPKTPIMVELGISLSLIYDEEV